MCTKDVDRNIKRSRTDTDIEDQGDSFKDNIKVRSNNELIPNAGKVYLGMSALF